MKNIHHMREKKQIILPQYQQAVFAEFPVKSFHLLHPNEHMSP